MKRLKNTYFKEGWLHQYFGILAFSYIFLFWIYSAAEVEPSLLLLVALYILIIPVAGQIFFAQHKFQFYTFSLAFVLGVYGFYTEAEKPYSIANSIYSTFRLFILDVDNVFDVSEGKLIRYPLVIEAARWMAALYTISTLFSLIYYKLDSTLKMLLIKMRGNHIVISGYNSFSELAAFNLSKSDYPVVLIADRIPEDKVKLLEQRGVLVRFSQGDRQWSLEKTGVQNAKYCLLFHEEEARNLDDLIAIKNLLLMRKNETHTPEIILHQKSSSSIDIIEDIEEGIRIEKQGKRQEEDEQTEEEFVPPFTLRIINIYRMLAEQLFNDYPLYKGYEERVRNKAGDALHLLVVGFGDTGRHIVLEVLERGHFINQSDLRVTILDRDAENLEKEWKRNYPHASNIANIQFVPYDSYYQRFDEVIGGNTFTHAFICLDGDYADIKEGFEVAKNYRDIPVFIKVNKQGSVSKWIHENKEPSAFKGIHQFGNLENVLNEKSLLNEDMSYFARRTHENYRKQQKQKRAEVPDEWERLNYFTQSSNRSTFHHLQTKLMLLGLKAVPANQGFQSINEQDYHSVDSSIIEDIAASEHHRWNAFHFLRGWTVMLDQDHPDYPKSVENKQHAALVRWDELKKLEVEIDKEYSTYCKESIVDLYEIVKGIDYVIVPYEEGEEVNE
ncbi:MAG: hypothetical protein ACQEUT_01625 [Bacillota bacterium]